MKICSICKQEKSFDSFYKSSKSKDGYQCNCKECARIRSNQWRKEHKSIAAKAMGRYRQTWEGAVRERYHNANYRAKQKGFDFNLTVEYLSDLLTDQNHQCALTGDDLSFVSGNPKKLSLDRISSKGGYTQGNVQWVTWEVNDAKRALENEAFILLCQKVCAKVEGSETIPEGSTSQA